MDLFRVDQSGNVFVNGLLLPKPQSTDHGKVLAVKGNEIGYEYVAPGNQGSTGNGILHGPVPPTPQQGNDGDFYYDTIAKRFYGPKSTNQWGEGFAIEANSNTISSYTASEQDSLDILGLDAMVGGTTDKKIKIDLIPTEETAALVVFTSTDGLSFASESYSYSCVAFDNDNALTASPNTGPKIYGSNSDNRAHLTPNYNSNLVGDQGICADIFIRNPEKENLITRIWGMGSYSEPDQDTNLFSFALAHEVSEKLSALRFRFRRRSDQSFIKFSGKATLYRDE